MSTYADRPEVGSVREFFGPDGARQLSKTGTHFTPIGPGPFRARLDSFTLGRTRIVSMQATPHRGELRATVGSMRHDLVFFTFLLAGHSVGHHDGSQRIDEPGSIHFVRVSAPFRFTADQPTHNVTWWVDLDQLQPEVAEALRRVSSVEFRWIRRTADGACSTRRESCSWSTSAAPS
ncbi:hypothetical protein HQQ81_19635 [Microbacteriaceae bacterium VKM Ac-2854]|nr:hypothetical protein [Microbacteriaceae bacterium VKM Ac-2854]